jgi:hypothetical protein
VFICVHLWLDFFFKPFDDERRGAVAADEHR